MTEPNLDEQIDDLIYAVRLTCEDCTHPRCLQTIKSAKALIANQVREARQDALNNWTYKIIGRIQGKELLFADDVREEVQKRIEGLQND